MQLTIVAEVLAVPGKEDLLRRELTGLVEPTRAEAGCLRYDLHEDNASPGLFLFYETWETRDLWRAHMEAPHITDFRAATEGAVADFKLYEMTQIA